MYDRKSRLTQSSTGDSVGNSHSEPVGAGHTSALYASEQSISTMSLGTSTNW